MRYTASIITVSDSCANGLREDATGPALARLLDEHGWEVEHTAIAPDDKEAIQACMLYASDELQSELCLTAGGTGFSQRDITPEATKEIIDREVPGIPEYMRCRSMQTGSRGMLSRQVSGIRGKTLFINLPGSRSGAVECYMAVAHALRHAIEMLVEEGSTVHDELDPTPVSFVKAAEAPVPSSRVTAVCVGPILHEKKNEVREIILTKGSGAESDAFDPEHPVCLLSSESVKAMQKDSPITLKPGAFSENILTEGLKDVKPGDVLKVGEALLEVIKVGCGCPEECGIRNSVGECSLTNDGIFANVLESGRVKRDDPIIVLSGEKA
jgi:molybdenum cofactor synthesis domain-containing protein